MTMLVSPASVGQGPLGPGRRFDWRTPSGFFTRLDAEFGFQLDACAESPLRAGMRFYGPMLDGLMRSWDPGPVFLNPPYGRELPRWLERAVTYASGPAEHGVTTVALVPARVDTTWWHELVMPFAAEVRCIRGRLRFDDSDGNPPFASVVVVYRAGVVGPPRFAAQAS